MPPQDLAPFLFSAFLVASVAFVLIFRGPLGRAITRRIEGAASVNGSSSTASILPVGRSMARAGAWLG